MVGCHCLLIGLFSFIFETAYIYKKIGTKYLVVNKMLGRSFVFKKLILKVRGIVFVPEEIHTYMCICICRIKYKNGNQIISVTM